MRSFFYTQSMTVHEMKLKHTPFTMIQNGRKTVECRLYDEKRQKILLGDHILFSLVDNPAETLEVEVTGLLRYPTFEAMFHVNEPRRFGGEDEASLTESLLTYYSLEEQHRNGVIGIELSRID